MPFDANQTARDQGVGVYVDGVYLGRQQGLNAALFDVERIEVLRGPQGTLFGRNTEGGAVSIVTKAPTGVFGVRGAAGIGNYGSYNGEMHLDLPAFANFAVKLDGDHPAPGCDGRRTRSRARRAGITTIASAAAPRLRWRPIDGLTVDCRLRPVARTRTRPTTAS